MWLKCSDQMPPKATEGEMYITLNDYKDVIHKIDEVIDVVNSLRGDVVSQDKEKKQEAALQTVCNKILREFENDVLKPAVKQNVELSKYDNIRDELINLAHSCISEHAARVEHVRFSRCILDILSNN